MNRSALPCNRSFIAAILTLLLFCLPAFADDAVKVTNLSIDGAITGPNISFILTFDAATDQRSAVIPLIVGDVVLEKLAQPADTSAISYDPKTKTYSLTLPRGSQHVEARFAARSRPDGNDAAAGWRIVSFDVPSSTKRELKVTGDRPDLEILFPDAMRVHRQPAEKSVLATAVLGPGKPFTVRYKPQVQALDAKLVASMEANLIATVSAGAMRLDALMAVDIAQGKLSELHFTVPAALSIMQVRGQYIRDWALSGKGESRTLTITLNRPQDHTYALQIVGQMLLGSLPTQVSVPVIAPGDGLRAHGQLLIGTDSAIQLLVKRTSGLSQIDNNAFGRVILDKTSPRALPSGKAFAYSFPGMPIALDLALDDIVPSYDALGRLVMSVREDDLIVEGQIELDVRDAPLRSVSIEVPGQFNVAQVSGPLVGDWRVTGSADKSTRRIDVQFKQPVIGDTLIGLRLELGRGPLGVKQTLSPPKIIGAKSQRGYLVLTAESSVQIDAATASDAELLKSVNTASVPMRVANAQQAWRYREPAWTLDLQASRKLAGVRTELFHLTSIGEGVTYGSVAVSYLVTGSPIDQMQFIIPAALKNIEFVGRDVTGWTHDGERWTVNLRRKVIGDYNLAITYTQRYADDQTMQIGGIRCAGVERQSGYIVIASHLNIQPAGDIPPGSALLAIEREEVPANYRLLAHAPILRCFKYVDAPHDMTVKINAFQHADLLPVVIEIADMHTKLDVRDDGACESITQIAYKIKNTSSQFLSLKLPPDAKFRRATLIRYNADGQELGRDRLAASFDAKTSALLLPLQRNINPNEPATVVMEYAQDHGIIGWAGHLALTAPQSDVPATFAQWRIDAPPTWSVQPDAAGNMVNNGEDTGTLNLSYVLSRTGMAWGDAVADVFSSTVTLFVAAIALGLLILVAVFRRRYTADVLILFILLAWLFVGVLAADANSLHQRLGAPPHSQSASFTQAVHLESAAPLNIALQVQPQWREHLQLIPAIGATALCIVCVVLTLIWRRLRGVFAAAAIVAAMYVMAQFSPLAQPLGYALTWGIPLVLLIALIGRWIWTGLRGKAATITNAAPAAGVVLLAAMLLTANGCGSTPVVTDSPQPVVQSIHVALSAETDSMATDIAVTVLTPGPGRLPLMADSAVLLTDDLKQPNVSVVRDAGRYWLKMEKAGKYDVAVKFLSPLEKADGDQSRHFVMPMPVALANDVTLTVGGGEMQIDSLNAVRLETSADEKSSTAQAIFMPGEPATFIWKPRARQRENEQTIFYTTTTSVWRFDSGAVEGRHDVHFQVAQGELKDITIQLAEGVTVTAVDGAKIGAWRYEPTTRELEVRLSDPAASDYVLHVVTQMSAATMPAKFAVGSLFVKDAARQHGTMGLLTSSSVYINVDKGPQTMNVDDFSRDSAQLLKGFAAMGSSPVRYAYRVSSATDTAGVTMAEVEPEIRVVETAGFTVTDERLQYLCSPLSVEVSKAGRFSIELRLPAEYDIDALSAPQVSHWDETTEGGTRIVQVHFRNKLLGTAELAIALSRPVSELPKTINVPRIEVVGAVKHTGQVVISADRGVRLSIAEREGVSEIRPEQLQRNEAKSDAFVRLAYQLLRPDWKLKLNTQVIEPLINVEYLHVANVSEGLVKHAHYLTYRLQHAGTKTFEFEVPSGALGLQIIGEAIARREKIEPNVWRVELTRKWLDDRPYALTVRYETPIDRDSGKLTLSPVVARGVDLQRGYVVINKEDRVELEAAKVGPTLSNTDARMIRGFVGAPDLSSAAFAYRSTAATYDLTMSVRRLSAAAQLEAQVKQTTLTSVITQRGEMMTQVQMSLRVGSKRLLEMRLPQDAVIWSLSINGKATAPSERTDKTGRRIMLIPLAQGAVGEVDVSMSVIYVQSLNHRAWRGEIDLAGPQFDLPLGQVQWRLYVPEGFTYDNFGGTLSIDDSATQQPRYQSYDMQIYNRNVQVANKADYDKAKQFQEQGQQLAQEGKGYAARIALEQGSNYSQSDASLNEDIRVQLHNLLRQQAKVGLVASRSRLRGEEESAGTATGVNGENLAPQQMNQIEASLDQADSDNLNVITNRMIDIQEAAAGQTTQLVIDMPLRGRVLEFERALQITPNAEMNVKFDAEPQMAPRLVGSGLGLGGLFAVFAVGLTVIGGAAKRWPNIRRKLTPPPPPAPEVLEDQPPMAS